MSEVVFYSLFVLIMVLGFGLVWIVQQYRQVLDRLFKLQKKQEIDKDAKELINEAQQEFIRDLRSAFNFSVDQVDGQMVSIVDEFRDKLAKQAEGLQEGFTKKIDEEFVAVNEELAAYRQKRIAQIDQEVATLIEKITKEALGKGLTIKDHEELVSKALEKEK